MTIQQTQPVLMPFTARPSAILDMASDKIAIHGLAKNVLVDSYGRMCVLGAMVQVCQELHIPCMPESDPAGAPWIAARNCLRIVVGYDIPSWNNDPARTDAEAVDALREAARIASDMGR